MPAETQVQCILEGFTGTPVEALCRRYALSESHYYRLRDRFLEGGRKLWDYCHPARVRKWFEGWYQRAIRSRIEPLKRFARALQERLHGILAHCRHRIHTGTLEGIDNKVKVIKRIAYGFRDHDYFFLKIRSHLTGVHPQ